MEHIIIVIVAVRVLFNIRHTNRQYIVGLEGGVSAGPFIFYMTI